MTDALLIMCFLVGLAQGAFFGWWFTSGHYLRQFRKWLDDSPYGRPSDTPDWIPPRDGSTP